MNKCIITKELVETISYFLRVDLSTLDMDDLIYGMTIELEHGLVNGLTNVTNDDMFMTYKIMLAHVKENKDYYKYLAIMEDLMKKNELDSLIDLVDKNALKPRP